MNVQVVFDAAVIAGLAWFWFRRARPALLGLGAEPLALRLALAATIVGGIAMLAHLAAVATGTGESAATWIRIGGGLLWILIVGLGHPQYRFLRHLTRTKRPGM
jgi:hypothetical protein